jgi:alkylated DNA repair dioxygenase AlkB
MTSLNMNESKVYLDSTSWYILSPLPDSYKCPDYKKLWDLHPATHATVKIFGKDHPVPRYLQAFGVDYNFSKSEHKSLPITDTYLLKLQEYVHTLDSNYKYNGILVNWYRDGNDYIGPHSDDESELKEGSNIYSFTFGATRDFLFKSKTNKSRVIIPLMDNTMLIMGGDTQKNWTHGVPKRLKCKESRINVTIRSFNEE